MSPLYRRIQDHTWHAAQRGDGIRISCVPLNLVSSWAQAPQGAHAKLPDALRNVVAQHADDDPFGRYGAAEAFLLMTQAYKPTRSPKSFVRSASAEAPLDLLIVGNVTRDEVSPNRKHALGGTAAFAARAASCIGVRCAVVTAAPTHFDLLDPVAADPGVQLHRVPCREETAFSLQYTEAGRRLDLLSQAPDLQAGDVPKAWRDLPCAYVAPIMGECSREMVESLGSRCVVICAQGWLRAVAPDGEVVPALGPEMRTPPRNATAIVLSELDHPDSDALAMALAEQGPVVAVTRSKKGVTLYTPERIDIAAAPAIEVDPTGAGDVFGLVFALKLAAGYDCVHAAKEAVAAAACVVEGPGLGNLTTWVAGKRSAAVATSSPAAAVRNTANRAPAQEMHSAGWGTGFATS